MNINLKNDLDPDHIPDEWLIERMRNLRNRLLKDSDWTQSYDDPTNNREAWAIYRQQLRDFPATWIANQIVEFPEPPTDNLDAN